VVTAQLRLHGLVLANLRHWTNSHIPDTWIVASALAALVVALFACRSYLARWSSATVREQLRKLRGGQDE
jgi:type VI protein secretion system component VasF